VPLWYGQLAENATQATAASLLREALVDLELGEPWPGEVVAHTHDEIVAECRAEDVKVVAATLEAVMSYVPDWAPGLPLAAEVKAGWAYYEADKALLT
jgi:DNA polymerase I-like protein with 3'-5' exonuclease and polymerase domains